MSQNTVLEIKDLEVELYSEKGPLPVIDKVNLSIKEGEIPLLIHQIIIRLRLR